MKNASFSISSTDYVQATLLFARCSTQWGIVYGMTSIFLLFVAFFSVNPAVCIFSIGILLGGAGGALVYRLMLPWYARRNYQYYKMLQDPMEIVLCDTGVRFNHQDGEHLLRWINIVKWRQNHAYILLYVSPQLFYIVPKQIVQNGFNLDALIRTLNTQLGPSC